MDAMTPVSELKGIGDHKTRLLAGIGIRTLDELIHYFPREYEIKKEKSCIGELEQGDIYLVEGDIVSEPQNLRVKKLVMTKLKIKDETGELSVVWYQQAYLKNAFKPGQHLILKGKVSLKMGRLQMESPKVIKEEELVRISDQTLLPIYPLSRQISGKFISELIVQAMGYLSGRLKDPLPLEIKKNYDLCEYNYALAQIHNPDDVFALEVAKKRLIFDEFLLFQMGLQMLRTENYRTPNGYQFDRKEMLNTFTQNLPFQLTGAQQRTWDEIYRDMTGQITMNRLVQGDVGSGKTIVAALALMLACENGYQATMMVPTEVLAKQHFISLNQLFEPLGIEIKLLVGSMTKKQKTQIYDELESGRIQVVIGTHALIQEGVKFNNLALVITDEQHRFGVKQRERLAGKGHFPHTLVMSATPIPRTLALIVFGDMDISLIDELPPGRQEIKTYSVNGSYRDRIYRFIEKEVAQGRQCYVVCPMVEDNEEIDDVASVVSYAETLKSEVAEGIRITYLHGKMKPKEKNAIMESFSAGDIDILVSTTVIEVGVNVPNATLMVIENADRFGLAGLHQLRGRVGRGSHQSHCVLISDSRGQATRQRLKVLEESTDGFYIAEYDLKLRGPGDAFGIKQHGLPEFRIGDLMENADLLKTTGELARRIIEEDPLLTSGYYQYLGEVMHRYFKEYMLQIAL